MAFHLKDPGDVENSDVLLVDNVVTTGATANACGGELLSAGAWFVRVAALASPYFVDLHLSGQDQPGSVEIRDGQKYA